MKTSLNQSERHQVLTLLKVYSYQRKLEMNNEAKAKQIFPTPESDAGQIASLQDGSWLMFLIRSQVIIIAERSSQFSFYERENNEIPTREQETDQTQEKN